MSEAALQEVFRSHAAHGGVVGGDMGNARVRQVADVDDRDFRLFDKTIDGGIDVQIANDAVPFPTGRNVAGSKHADVQNPLRLAGISSDAAMNGRGIPTEREQDGGPLRGPFELFKLWGFFRHC